ncbi:MAG TPA: ATP-binding cassette domain-containing protein, partial [Anaerolineae bacterium]|nr:ATP-binding cassette domain-containing protein [Anaerolineae bacterium]
MANKIEVEHLNFYYNGKQALIDINLNMPERQITALIGPSGCGKSTFLRCLNRMNDTIPGTRAEGSIKLDGANVLDPAFNV